MFVWMAKFGAAYGVRTGIHVGVDVGGATCSTAVRARARSFCSACSAGAFFTFVVGTMGAQVRRSAFIRTDQVSPDLEMPRWIIFLCVPLGSYLMCFRFLQVAWNFWRTGELPHHDRSPCRGRRKSTRPRSAAEELAGKGGAR